MEDNKELNEQGNTAETEAFDEQVAESSSEESEEDKAINIFDAIKEKGIMGSINSLIGKTAVIGTVVLSIVLAMWLLLYMYQYIQPSLDSTAGNYENVLLGE